MKRGVILTAILFFVLLSLNAVAFMDNLPISESTDYVFLTINVFTAILVLTISLHLYKFINITRKHIAFILIYFCIALLLFSSIVNIFYFFLRSQVQYLPVYLIDRIIILVILVIIFIGFKKFRKKLSTKS